MIGAVPGWVRPLAVLFVIAIAIFMLAPLVVVVASSVSASEFLVFPPRGLSGRWYAEVLQSDAYLSAAWTSLLLALMTVALSLSLGTAAALALARFRIPGRAFISSLFLSPLILPSLIFAIGLLMVFSIYGNGPSLFGLVIGHTVITLPYVIRTVTASLADMDPHLDEAARMMGARWWQRYFLVILPQCRTGMAAGAFFAFNISFDDAVVALFMRAPDVETLPMRIYSTLEFSPDPSVAAVSTIMIAMTAVLVLLLDRIFGLSKIM
ncbi:ABC transporter permease [Rhodobium gokarnense]|uniref:Spermidine/putrescine transport system permease protein n=1 Tax=Rhodobium gokarnense TaxID=364296 RepID=A0ABT3H6D7_9HYPH|nr:ABC transporter permease [Rhodobium gokarnense]MCW2305953.1 putative spermidine/putrescine transport system permease protein [Rhodobium gokarnense]